MPRPLNVVAIVAAYNEEDIIGQTVQALIDDGIQVYFLDHHSTDRTLAEVSRFKGKGVIGIETFPVDPADHEAASTFVWEQILARKEQLARTLKADWFIHHDADEFRESPWAGLTLSDAIARVDAAGYNAIDFHVLNFRPTSSDPASGTDIRKRLAFYEPGRTFDRVQIKCWKKTDAPVVLTATGGHSAQFAGRRIFPIRFLLRHYPIRSDAHGRRKVFEERVPRFSAGERARGWHVQYDDLKPDAPFVSDAGALVRYDPEAVRMELWLHHREFERVERAAAVNQDEADRLTDDQAPLRIHLSRQDEELGRLRPELVRLQAEAAELKRAVDAYREVADRRTTEDDELRRHLNAQDEELDRFRKERPGVMADLDSARRHVQAQDEELARLRPERTKLIADLEASRSHGQNLEVERDAKASELETARRHARTQDLQVERLISEGAVLQEKHEAMLRAHAVLQTNHSTLQRDYAEAQRAHATLQQEFEAIEHRLSTQQATVARLRPERDRLRAELDELRQFLIGLDVEIDRVRQQRDEAGAELDTVRAQLARRDTTVAYMLASRSWTMTAPLRAVDRLISGRSSESTGRGLAVANFPAGGGLRLGSDVPGMWGDGWAGRELRFRIHAGRRITAVRVIGVVPDELAGGQRLHLSTPDQAWTHHAAPGRFEWVVPLALDQNGVSDIVITADSVWRPASSGGSNDARDLAWHVERVEGR